MWSILWWILYAWEALGCMFSNLSLDSCIGNKGEKERWRKVALHPRTYPNSQGGACAFLLHFWLVGVVVCCTKSVWPILVTSLTGLVELVWPVLGTGLTSFVPSVGTCSGGVCICGGGALLCFGGLCSLLDHSFVSDVSSRCPCLRGPRPVFFKWSCSMPFLIFRSLVGISVGRFFSF
jgi:hypothetical protein